ncbi:DUF3775 domain-containing protein [Methylobacterium sp. Leaf118]|uniref:DUF3775 domain-containing protein n=1 Tax=Methylobacterium sp. Leaf118 TaxID=2876562 RepID=UPI001E4D43D9|nr:DUF3775 domain-containing protein [Methylobacterium sp. Leaf118]
MDIALDKLTDLILRLRAVEAKEGATDPDSGSNPIDDGATDVLVGGTDDATEQEIRSAVAGFNEDERSNLLALIYIGRGDLEAAEWGEAVRFAREREAAGDTAIRELLGTPEAAALLEEGLDALGITLDTPQA